MQTCTQQRISAGAACSPAQSSARRSIAANSSANILVRTQKRANALAQPLAAKPFGVASAPSRVSLQVVQAAQAAPGKLISKVEIPAFIPRRDLIDQLLRWAIIEVQENGMGNVGCPCKVNKSLIS